VRIPLLVASFLVANPPAAQAAVITVTTTAEELNVDGDCSLREAIAAANGDAPVDACPAGSGVDTIVIPAGTYPIGLELAVTSDLTISGAAAATTIWDGGGSGRVLNIATAVTATVQGVTITNGNGNGGGGIFNLGGLTVTNSTISGNVATGDGGGIFNLGGLTVANSTISGNNGGSFGLGGGGIFNQGNLTVTNSTISGNNAEGLGGGILNFGVLTVTNSTIAGNVGDTGDGIFYAFSPPHPQPTRLRRTTTAWGGQSTTAATT